MNSIAKIVILALALAVVLPLANPEKFLNWLPPYGANSENVFQVAGAQIANFSLSRLNLAGIKTKTAAAPEQNINPPAPTVKEKKFTAPQKPYRILLVGDSFVAVAGGFGDIAEQKLIQFADVSVLRQGKVSSGLSRPDFYDWQAEAQIAILKFKPNIAIVMMGTNDAQSFEIWKDQKKRVAAFGTAEWDAQYQNRAQSFIKEFTGNGAIVYWIGLPAMRDQIYAQKIKHLAQLQESAVKNNSQAKFISAAELLAGEKAAYQPFAPDENGIMRATRNPDGIHLSYFGGTLLVEKIIAELKKDIDLSIPAPTSPAKNQSE